MNDMDPSVREILVSFQVANLVGGAVVTHDTVGVICGTENLELVSISILLSLGHVIKLMVAEYTILTSSIKKGPREHYRGLIVLYWLLSFAVGLLISTITQDGIKHVTNITVSLGVIIVFVTIVAVYTKIIRRDHWVRQRLLFIRNSQLDHKHRKHICPKVYEELKYVPFIVMSYIVCTLPWTIRKIYDGLRARKSSNHLHYTTLLLFALGFYIPALVPIHMWKKLRSRKIEPSGEEVESNSQKEGSMLQFTSLHHRRSTLFCSGIQNAETEKLEWATVRGVCVMLA